MEQVVKLWGGGRKRRGGGGEAVGVGETEEGES